MVVRYLKAAALLATSLVVGSASAQLLEGLPDPAFGGTDAGTASVDFNLMANAYDDTAGLRRLGNGKLLLAARVAVPIGGIRRFRHGLARFNADGTADLSFSGDGKVVPAVPDPNFDYQPAGLVFTSEGKTLIFGARNDLQNQLFPAVVNVCRYNAAGGLDTTFDEDGCANPVIGIVEGETERVMDVDTLSNGGILITGQIEDDPTPGIDWSAFVYKLTANGAQDFSYGDGGLGYTLIKPANCDWCTPRSAVTTDDGSIYVFGSNQFAMSFVAKLDPNGLLDPSFGVGGYAIFSFANLHAIPGAQEFPVGGAIDSQGRIYHCGFVRQQNDNGKTVMTLARLDAAGMLDPSFGQGGRLVQPLIDVLPMSTVRDCLVDSADRLVMAVAVGGADGTSADFGVVRYLPSGERDARFNLAGFSRRGIDLGGPGIGHDLPKALIEDQGGLVLAGTANLENTDTPMRKLMLLRWRDEGVFSNSFE